jgi:DNA transformation protein and related proteins
MSASDGYLTFVLDQLRTVLPMVRVRSMFGARGLYAGDLFFAVIDDDTLYLKVDDETRGDYESRGMPPFQPMEGHASMNYSQLPEELLEEPEALRPWVERAVEVARRARARRTTRKSPSTAVKKPTKRSTKKSAKRSIKPSAKRAARKKTPKKPGRTR